MQKIKLENINELLQSMAQIGKVYAPIEKAGQVNYYEWNKDAKLRLDVLNTVKSAKDVFFPQTEDLASFKTEGKEISIQAEKPLDEDFAVFGVRACDVKSFDILDKVFIEENTDEFYKARREHGVVISHACNEPEETCFCTTFGIDASAPKGDIETYTVGDTLYWLPVTDKGKEYSAKLGNILEEADESQVNKQKETIKAIMDKLPLKDVTTQAFGAGKTMEYFDRPEWKELSEADART